MSDRPRMTFTVTIEETERGWESTVTCSDGPTVMLVARSTVWEAQMAAIEALTGMTKYVED